MKRNLPGGHLGKGKYCHTCAPITNAKQEETLARQNKRLAKLGLAATDPIDMSTCLRARRKIVSLCRTIQR